jgi:hypothetical protein
MAETKENDVSGHWPTIHLLEDGDGYYWTSCPECGPDVQVDEDGACVHCGHTALGYGRAEPVRGEEADLRDAALAVVAYWDSLDSVASDDERPTEDFMDEMDKRINALREEIGR